MTERSYREERYSASRFTRLLGFVLIGFVILLIGVILVAVGLTWEDCVFLGGCRSTVNYSLVGVGVVFLVTSSPVFVLAWKSYRQPERRTIISDVQQPIMVRCSHCNSTFPKGTSTCYHCGASL